MGEFTGNILYGRRYRIIVGTGGTGLDVSRLKCAFSIEKSMSETPNYSEVTIYNLSAATENSFITAGDRIIVEAGYEGEQYGLIFDGDVVQPIREKEDGVTYKLTLISQDGDLFLNEGIINASYRAGQTPRTIAAEVTGAARNPIALGSISENLENVSLPRGKVCFGLARDYLRQVARTEAAAFYVNDRVVNIVKATDLPAGEIIDLSPASGLVGAGEQTEDGIKGKCLLNPLINLNSFIHVDNSHVRAAKTKRDSQPKQLDQDGVYRVIKIRHIGDTRGDNWYTEFTGISQSGAAPDTIDKLR